MSNIELVYVDILISTYNGGKYLSKQLDSILHQTHEAFSIIVRDDGSSDETVDILEDYSNRFPEKLSYTVGENIGIVRSYNRLMDLSESPYILFCDQDDIWLRHKIELMLSTITGLEMEFGCKIPALVYSDMKCIDENDCVTDHSFWMRHGIDGDHNSFNQLLLQNVVTGTATCFNRELLLLTRPVSQDGVLHDWWLALHASACGRILSINEPLVLYRLHGNNAIGANGINFDRFTQFIADPSFAGKRINKIMGRCIAQAKAFVRISGQHMQPKDIEFANKFVKIEDLSFIDRRLFIIKNRILFSSLIRNIILMLFWR